MRASKNVKDNLTILSDLSNEFNRRSELIDSMVQVLSRLRYYQGDDAVNPDEEDEAVKCLLSFFNRAEPPTTL